MQMKKVSMPAPTSQAGIVGLSANEKLSDIEIDPKIFLAGVVILLVIAKIFHIVIG